MHMRVTEQVVAPDRYRASLGHAACNRFTILFARKVSNCYHVLKLG